MAGPWTISRDRQDANGGDDLRAVISQAGTRPLRALVTRLPGRRPVRPLPFAQHAGALSFPPFTPPASTGQPAAPPPPSPAPHASLDRPTEPAARSRGRRPVKAAWALTLLIVITAAAVALTWATVSIAERGVAASRAAARRSAGPLVIPAPKTAGGLPLRVGSTTEPGDAAIITELRERFGGVGYRLVLAAKKSAEASGDAAVAAKITAAWTSGLYGQPGHVDPATGKPAWVMYLGLDATAEFGSPADSVGQLMMGILGPSAKIGPWRVNAGHRGVAANCTVAWLGQTMVSVCGWATSHTIGALASPVRDTSVAELATLMISMRYELQRK